MELLSSSKRNQTLNPNMTSCTSVASLGHRGPELAKLGFELRLPFEF